MSEQVTHYKLINTRPLIFGIEFSHTVIIGVVFILTYLFTSSLLVVLVVVSGLYLLAKMLMARKSRQWLDDFLGYQLGVHVYSACHEKKREVTDNA